MRNKSLISLVTALLILLASAGVYGGGYFLLMKLHAHTADLQKQIAEKTIELDRATQARSALATLSNDEAVLNQYQISKSDVVPFLEALQTSGKPLGAKVDVLSVSDAKDGTHARISLSLAVTGSFDAVMRTLGIIEYGPYDGVITSLSLDNSRDGKGTIWTAAVLYSVGVRSASSTPSKP